MVKKEKMPKAMERKMLPIDCLNLIRPSIKLCASAYNIDSCLEISHDDDEEEDVLFYKRPMVPYESYSIIEHLILKISSTLKKVLNKMNLHTSICNLEFYNNFADDSVNLKIIFEKGIEYNRKFHRLDIIDNSELILNYINYEFENEFTEQLKSFLLKKTQLNMMKLPELCNQKHEV